MGFVITCIAPAQAHFATATGLRPGTPTHLLLNELLAMPVLAFGLNFPNQTVRLVTGTGREIQHVIVMVLVVAAETQGPQTADRDGVSLGIRERTQERARARMERVDAPVAKVADEQRAAECAEMLWRQRKAPRRIQWAVRSEALQQMPVQIEQVNETVAGAGFVIFELRRLLLGECDQ